MAEAFSERDRGLVLDIVLAAQDVQDFVNGMDLPKLIASRLHQNAVVRSLEVIGEAASKISQAAKLALPDVPWREMTAMRHRLIHGYADVRLDLVWTVATTRMNPLIAGPEPVLANMLPGKP